jgi:glycine/D-amino acid oxidase-like deaminating enzyme
MQAMSRVLVVGGGVFGISAAIALKRRGWDVELFETGRIPRVEAASTDISKIVRMDYGSDALYTELMEQAFPVWRAWNERWGGPVYHQEGFLVLSDVPMRPGGFEHDSLKTLIGRGHVVTRLSARELTTRFPAWDGSRYPDGYFNALGGWAESGRVVGLMLEDARGIGVRVHEGRSFGRLIEDGSRVTGVATSSGETVRGDLVLVAAGAWTPVIVDGLDELMWPVAQPVFHLKPRDPGAWRPPRFPVWAAAIASTGWYGFPANATGILKLANHGPGRRVDPDAPRVIAPEEEARLRTFLRESLPGLAEAPLASAKTCLYCDSFDGDFFIGRDPQRQGLAVAAGDSGHGFKFAPVLGDVIADAVLERPSRFTERFAWRTKAERKAEGARFGLS